MKSSAADETLSIHASMPSDYLMYSDSYAIANDIIYAHHGMEYIAGSYTNKTGVIDVLTGGMFPDINFAFDTETVITGVNINNEYSSFSITQEPSPMGQTIFENLMLICREDMSTWNTILISIILMTEH